MTGNTRRTRNRTGLSTRKVRHLGASRDATGCKVKLTHKTLGPQALADRAAQLKERQQFRLQEMTADERRALEALRDVPDASDDPDEVLEDFNVENILDGAEPLNISHAGGEFEALTKELSAEYRKMHNRHIKHRANYRTRRDRIVRRERAFHAQISALTDAFLDWSLARSEDGKSDFFTEYTQRITKGVPADAGSVDMKVVDILVSWTVPLPILPNDQFVASALVRQGVMPCSPISPSVGITIDALELYRVSHLRCPQLSIQAFVKTLCDLHTIEFQKHLSRQFSIAYDLYLDIRARIKTAVQIALGRDSPDWRLKHACPACTYTLKDEQSLLFKLLYAMDGNDSLKRIIRRMLGLEDDDSPGPSSEMPSIRKVKDDRYIARDIVDKWAHAGLQQLEGGDLTPDETDNNPCAGRWKNMKEDITKRMWGIFDETGIFLALCWHGFTLVIADMVQSGELAKYPLAIVEKLLDAFGKDLGGGFDIRCKFKTTLNNSALGPRARELRHTCLVGAFHGHAHRRLCQLSHLATYTKGLGLEDLEGCERAFSKSNGLAGALRYASVFHRMQGIATYFEHNDNFEVYSNLTTFLYNNYKQALNILEDGSITLPQAMRELGVTERGIFDTWLEEEKQYLTGLQKEPDEETLQMEYWQRLVTLRGSESDLAAIANIWVMDGPVDTVAGRKDTTRNVETARRHAFENHARYLNAVQEIEMKLGIDQCWEPEGVEWQHAGKLVAMRKYRRALDTLEGLVVARIFELTKMNRSQTGYALRKHIGKALQVRSAAIRTALDRYNTAALALSPPRRTLEWKEVVEYAFLSDFDLLRDTRQDITQRPWATPAGRLAMDTHFKMLRAAEEIDRLNLEIRRVATYLRDEDKYLRGSELAVSENHPRLAHQISLYRMERGRFNSRHIRCLRRIAQLPGFSGNVSPGDSIQTALGESASPPLPPLPPFPVPMAVDEPGATGGGNPSEHDLLEDLEEEEEEDDSHEEASRVVHAILHVSGDV